MLRLNLFQKYYWSVDLQEHLSGNAFGIPIPAKSCCVDGVVVLPTPPFDYTIILANNCSSYSFYLNKQDVNLL
jgi:hypothetical protein